MPAPAPPLRSRQWAERTFSLYQLRRNAPRNVAQTPSHLFSLFLINVFRSILHATAPMRMRAPRTPFRTIAILSATASPQPALNDPLSAGRPAGRARRRRFRSLRRGGPAAAPPPPPRAPPPGAPARRGGPPPATAPTAVPATLRPARSTRRRAAPPGPGRPPAAASARARQAAARGGEVAARPQPATVVAPNQIRNPPPPLQASTSTPGSRTAAQARPALRRSASGSRNARRRFGSVAAR